MFCAKIELKVERTDDAVENIAWEDHLVEQEPPNLHVDTFKNTYDCKFEVSKHEICVNGVETGHLNYNTNTPDTKTEVSCELEPVEHYTTCNNSPLLDVDRKKTQNRIHNYEKPYACNKCNIKYLKRGWLKKHLKTHNIKKYICDTCSKEFMSRTSLSGHLRTHEDDEPHVCGICSAKFQSISMLNSHLYTHTDSKPHLCLTCNSRFASESLLKTHLHTHTADKLYPCPVCYSKFKYISVLRRHMKAHNPEKPYVCNHCDFTSRTTYCLDTHVKLKHPGDKFYSCTLCNQKFKQKSRMIEHKLDHTIVSVKRMSQGRLPYTCDLCFKKFEMDIDLCCHMRSHRTALHETDNRLYYCPSCPFETQGDYNMMLHNIEKHSQS